MAIATRYSTPLTMLIAAHTLGCKLNFAETSHLMRQMAEQGHTIVDFSDKADLYIVNTCTVTAMAEKKCRNAVRQAVALNPSARVAVIGCFAQRAADTIAAMPGVTLVLGNDRKHLLPQMLATDPTLSSTLPSTRDADTTDFDTNADFQLQYSTGDRTRSFLKIQDGCDYFCTYCAIPFARGRSRSATVEQTIKAAQQIAHSGATEIVLTGVNTGTFGQQHGQQLIDLLRRLDDIEGIARYRISSIEPNLLTDEIIDFVATSRAFLPHFHIPLQAGTDRLLRAMHRRYTTALYSQKLQTIKSLMPDACIAADIMAGFNGEDEAEFDKAKAFVASLPISYLHVFTYSERPGTAALRQEGRIDIATRRAHTQQMLLLSDKKHRDFINSQLGKVRPVLWESTPHSNQSLMLGWTDNYIRLCRPFSDTMIGKIESVVIKPDNIAAESV
ncbi:MAG: tRNA (N(6)-L-threonylcarbamoyladenosine(37)-C(2))-methylthiotransferase MtaB [Bacteroidales bacterium]|nr:tRNA (N(6)-L-threonylcarbamoyladenosine(37)-C(2))-methylthiotransferase MtaB [Bacteroidales bacterium]